MLLCTQRKGKKDTSLTNEAYDCKAFALLKKQYCKFLSRNQIRIEISAIDWYKFKNNDNKLVVTIQTSPTCSGRVIQLTQSNSSLLNNTC